MTRSAETPSTRDVDGIWNFRDVGGAGSAVGIRPGLLFRSSELSRLSPGGARTLLTFGVTDLYDLRSPSEVSRSGADRVTGGIRVHQVPFASPVPDGLRAPHEIAYRQMMLDSVASGVRPDPARQIDFMVSEYRRFVGLPGTLAAIRAVAERLSNDAPALVHCAAGKDRTGFLVGVLLDAVGIGSDDITDDYLLSNLAIEAMRAHIAAQMRQAEPELADTLAATLTDEVLGVREEYLQAGFDQVSTTFGSSAAMLEVAGVDATARARLRRVLTG